MMMEKCHPNTPIPQQVWGAAAGTGDGSQVPGPGEASLENTEARGKPCGQAVRQRGLR